MGRKDDIQSIIHHFWILETAIPSKPTLTLNIPQYIPKQTFKQIMTETLDNVLKTINHRNNHALTFSFETLVESLVTLIKRQLLAKQTEIPRLLQHFILELKNQIQLIFFEYPEVRVLSTLLTQLIFEYLRSPQLEFYHDIREVITQYEESKPQIKYFMFLFFTELAILHKQENLARAMLLSIRDNIEIDMKELELIGLATWELQLRALVGLFPPRDLLLNLIEFINEYGDGLEEASFIIETIIQASCKLNSIDLLVFLLQFIDETFLNGIKETFILALINNVNHCHDFVTRVHEQLNRDVFNCDPRNNKYIKLLQGTLSVLQETKFSDEQIYTIMGLTSEFAIEEQLFLRAILVSLFGDRGHLNVVRNYKSELTRLFMVLMNIIPNNEMNVWWEEESAHNHPVITDEGMDAKENARQRRYVVTGLIPQALLLSEGDHPKQETIRTVEEMMLWMPHDMKIRLLKLFLPKKLITRNYNDVIDALKLIEKQGYYYKGGIIIPPADAVEITEEIIIAITKLPLDSLTNPKITEIIELILNITLTMTSRLPMINQLRHYFIVFQSIINGLRDRNTRMKGIHTQIYFDEFMEN